MTSVLVWGIALVLLLVMLLVQLGVSARKEAARQVAAANLLPLERSQFLLTSKF